MLGWLSKLRAFRQKNEGLIELTADGFNYFRHGKIRSMAWNAVTRIDVARTPNLVVEDFWIILFSGEKFISLCDTLFGFKTFEKALLDQWPEIEKSLEAVFTGPPDVEERATLWQQRESY